MISPDAKRLIEASLGFKQHLIGLSPIEAMSMLTSLRAYIAVYEGVQPNEDNYIETMSKADRAAFQMWVAVSAIEAVGGTKQ